MTAPSSQPESVGGPSCIRQTSEASPPRIARTASTVKVPPSKLVAKTSKPTRIEAIAARVLRWNLGNGGGGGGTKCSSSLATGSSSSSSSALAGRISRVSAPESSTSSLTGHGGTGALEVDCSEASTCCHAASMSGASA